MTIPLIKHPEVTYANGEKGILLTSNRKDTTFPVLTIRNKHQNIIYHDQEGRYLGMKNGFLNIINVDE